LIARNAAFFGVPDLAIVEGKAPEALEGLPAPDAVFIGGGIMRPGLQEACWHALKPGGRIVANAVTMEGEVAVARLHRTFGGTLTRIAVSHAEPVGKLHGWRPQMQVTQFAEVKS
jgi:precorrin-6Y C5,15-methyltransferase (decarboxylating)